MEARRVPFGEFGGPFVENQCPITLVVDQPTATQFLHRQKKYDKSLHSCCWVASHRPRACPAGLGLSNFVLVKDSPSVIFRVSLPLPLPPPPFAAHPSWRHPDMRQESPRR